jgi:hypothetical protein
MTDLRLKIAAEDLRLIPEDFRRLAAAATDFRRSDCGCVGEDSDGAVVSSVGTALSSAEPSMF